MPHCSWLLVYPAPTLTRIGRRVVFPHPTRVVDRLIRYRSTSIGGDFKISTLWDTTRMRGVLLTFCKRR